MVGFCMSGGRGRFKSRVRVSQHYKKTASFITRSEDKSDDQIKEFSFNSCFPESESGNRVMVVIDSTSEAEAALQWALSHTLQSHDTIILLHLAKQVSHYLSSNTTTLIK
ncbi:hypothetical protein ACS0TY_030556 [Phlomoides rotata]